ncbi:MAG: stage IV sporulation protein A [Clostridia bacterium]|nr:stage IV sporulation protein A [Clostridia bacterium]
MSLYKIYEDIATRTSGDVYVGVVGPVRCGKSTFISNFINSIVLPNIKDENDKIRTRDELPQSADGKTIMTTQPHFIPKEAVKIQINDVVNLKLKMVDCVGFGVEGAEGLSEGNKPRLVKTPWDNDPIPFELAAEIGTKRVISEHATIGVMVTTDGSFGDLPRNNFIQAEEFTVKELKSHKKPFVIILNTTIPQSDITYNLCETLEKKYDAPVIPMDVKNLTEDNIDDIFKNILQEFPIYSLRVKMPQWLQALPFDDDIIQEILQESKKIIEKASKIGEINQTTSIFANSSNFEEILISDINMGDGTVYLDIKPKGNLFYKVLSKQCGQEITSDFQLVGYLKQLSYAKTEFDKIKDALYQVEQTGYGVVSPKMEEMHLEEPELVKQGSRYGVRLKASAPSLHIMKVDVQTEISPIVGSEQQGEDLVKSLLKEFENDPQGIWQTNMFGRSLHSLVNEGLNKKIVAMPIEAQKKMRKTLTRIVNEGKGGIICILL